MPRSSFRARWPIRARFRIRLHSRFQEVVRIKALQHVGIWDQPNGGTQLYREFHQNLPLTDGAFSIMIGTGDFKEGTLDASLRISIISGSARRSITRDL